RIARTPDRDRAAARRSLEDLARTIDHTLKRRRMGCRRLRGEEALRLVWDGLHPSGTLCPPLSDLAAPVDALNRLEAPAVPPRRRAHFPGLGVLLTGLG